MVRWVCVSFGVWRYLLVRLHVLGPGLLEVYKKYTDIFSKELASILPQNSKYDYAIDLEEG